MPTGVLINGAGGRMGRAASLAIENAPDLHIAGKTHRTDDLAACIRNIEPDVVLDLTTANVAYANAKAIIDAGVSRSSAQADCSPTRPTNSWLCVETGIWAARSSRTFRSPQS